MGVTEGMGMTDVVEVIAGVYTVRSLVFGYEFTEYVNVEVGKILTVTLNVATAN